MPIPVVHCSRPEECGLHCGRWASHLLMVTRVYYRIEVCSITIVSKLATCMLELCLDRQVITSPRQDVTLQLWREFFEHFQPEYSPSQPSCDGWCLA